MPLLMSSMFFGLTVGKKIYDRIVTIGQVIEAVLAKGVLP
jgi:hypothetical protein